MRYVYIVKGDSLGITSMCEMYMVAILCLFAIDSYFVTVLDGSEHSLRSVSLEHKLSEVSSCVFIHLPYCCCAYSVLEYVPNL